MTTHKLKISFEKCIGCGQCEKDCVAHNIALINGKAALFSQDCILCGHCEAICPAEAITIDGYETKPIAKEEDVRLNPHDVLQVIRFRRTVRQFQDKDIPRDVLEQLLEAGRMTHTAKNAQDVSFVVLDKDITQVEKLAVCLFRKVKPFADLFSSLARRNTIDDHFFFLHAPKVIVIAAKERINGALAAQNMEFVAEANGLGVLFSGYFTTAANVSRKIRNALGIKKGKKVVATLVLGYPKVHYRRSAQREKADVRYL